MQFLLFTLGVTVALLPSAAVACSCAQPDELTERQLRFLMKDLALIARGRVVKVQYPVACRVAVLRWAYALTEARLPVTYTIAVSRTFWGGPVKWTTVVQRQTAEWESCKPLGSAACEAPFPAGDTLWVLYHLSNGEQRHAGRCGRMLAPYFLQLAHRFQT